MDALLKDKRVFKSKLTGLEKQIIAWQNETKLELLGIYLCGTQELMAECNSLLKSIGQQCEEKRYGAYEEEFDDLNNRLLAVQAWLRGRVNQGTDMESVTSPS
jgi:hypothetical protein